MPKEENLNNFEYHSVDFFAFGIILIEIFYSNGSLAVQLARHSQYCWSTSQKLFDILKLAAGKNDFYIELNRIKLLSYNNFQLVAFQYYRRNFLPTFFIAVNHSRKLMRKMNFGY